MQICLFLPYLQQSGDQQPLSGLASPYPPSPVISEVTFAWDTHRREAPGSDNWPVTWGADGHQYTTWGDGGGFGGTGRDGRVSLGFGRIEGDADSYRGVNLWGGANAKKPAEFTGKSYGILSVDGRLYAWRCGDESEETAYKFQELYQSDDRGESWEFTGVRFKQDDFRGKDRGFFCPTFLQFGKDYQGAKDDFIYIYAPEIQTGRWEVHKPGEISLLRAPQDSLDDQNQYQYFAGLTASGKPVWKADINLRSPVFRDPENGVMRISASYNKGIGRYFLIVEHSQRSGGNLGIFDAPNPWGPWTTVLFTTSWGSPYIEPSTFFWNFSNKWMSENGRRFVLVFTGRGKNDSWNTVEGEFVLKDPNTTLLETLGIARYDNSE